MGDATSIWAPFRANNLFKIFKNAQRHCFCSVPHSRLTIDDRNRRGFAGDRRALSSLLSDGASRPEVGDTLKYNGHCVLSDSRGYAVVGRGASKKKRARARVTVVRAMCC